jgi:hypothetical protein
MGIQGTRKRDYTYSLLVYLSGAIIRGTLKAPNS